MPEAVKPPNTTKATPIRNLKVRRLPSRATSSATAHIGIVAAARAAVTAFVIDCESSKSIEPMPKPKKPIQKPFLQGSWLNEAAPKVKAISPTKKISPNKFLKVIREMIPHVSKRLFAAGKPKENNPTANMQFRLPEAVELCAFNLFSIKE